MAHRLRWSGPVLLLVCLLLTSGCLRLAPKKPVLLSAPAVTGYSIKEFDADTKRYRDAALLAATAPTAANLEAAKALRNAMSFRIMFQIDSAYGSYETGAFLTRAGVSTAGDAATLGLTAASTVVGTAGVKDILTATATALAGTRLSVDKNFFEQKTTEALLSQMRASRKTLKAQILLSLNSRDVASYPLESAWTDLADYYYAGTLSSALIDIASKAGADEVKAKADLATTEASLLPAATQAQADAALRVDVVYAKLAKELKSDDPAVQDAAAKTLRKIAAAGGFSAASDASGADMLKAFAAAIHATAGHPETMAPLQAAVQQATAP